MRQFLIKPIIFCYDHSKDFVAEFAIGDGDCIITNKSIFNPYFSAMEIAADVFFLEEYGEGEPSVEGAEAIYAEMDRQYKRIIGIGGGPLLDLTKIYALETITPLRDLFERKASIVKNKDLLLIPTTCCTGSETNNISVLEETTRHAQLVLAAKELYADAVVLIPQLLERLQYREFAATSMDALIHAAESYVSPRASPFSRMLARQATEIILSGYQDIARDGELARVPRLADFLVASNYAGISYGNAGVGAVHAMGHPLGGKCRLPHGEANNALFTRVFETYQTRQSNGALAQLNSIVASALGCDAKDAHSRLADLLERILPRQPLRNYDVTMADLLDFTDEVMTKQRRLMANNYVHLNHNAVLEIYQSLF